MAFFCVSLSPSLLSAFSALSFCFCDLSVAVATWGEPCRVLIGAMI